LKLMIVNIDEPLKDSGNLLPKSFESVNFRYYFSLAIQRLTILYQKDYGS
jgi:hypothetical protein